jgi:hypothetical protein
MAGWFARGFGRYGSQKSGGVCRMRFSIKLDGNVVLQRQNGEGDASALFTSFRVP